jgi:formylglycine-generating enzyme required for sulfatase activity
VRNHLGSLALSSKPKTRQMQKTLTFFSATLALLFLSATKLPKSLRSDFNFIPSGQVKLNGSLQSVQAYYLLNHEVTNLEYSSFLNYLNTHGTEEEKALARVRNENWINEFNEFSLPSVAQFYHTHPAYDHYPVVNITHEAATLYCSWQEKWVNQQLSKTGIQVKVRLPYHAELVRAGSGDDFDNPYAWKGSNIRNAQENVLCNFTQIPEASLTRDEDGKLIISPDYAYDHATSGDILAPSKSYWPSEFGIYNLNGNVAEMTNVPGEAVGGSWRNLGYDVRLQSTSRYMESSCTVGFRTVFTVL